MGISVACWLIYAGLFVSGPAPAQWLSVGFDDRDMAADLTEALTFRKYPTYPQYLEMMQYFAATYPGICRVDTFGTSAGGRLLLALNISDQVDAEEPEPDFLYTAAIHGNELVGIVLLLRLAHTLLEGYGQDVEVDRLVEGLSIWINPLSNPDGTYEADQGLSMKGAQRVNLEGVDLNRDFPEPGLDFSGDTAGRASETIAMMEFMRKRAFTLSANLHSGAEVVNYPWDHTYALHADDPWYRFVSREYADEARAVDPGYMALFTNGITNGAEWYRVFGGRQDFVNFFLGGREVTLELSEEKLLSSDQLEAFWEKNQRSLLNYRSQCTYGIRGTVTDAGSGIPLIAQIAIPGHDSAYSVIHSGELYGDFYRLIREGTYDLVVSSPGYLNDTIRDVEVTDYMATTLEIRLQEDPKAGLPATGTDSRLRIYPNPATELLFVDPAGMEPGSLEVRILSMEGTVRILQIFNYTGAPIQLTLDSLSPGLYFLRINDGKQVLTAPLILQ